MAVYAGNNKDGVSTKTGIALFHLVENKSILMVHGSWRDGACGLGFIRSAKYTRRYDMEHSKYGKKVLASSRIERVVAGSRPSTTLVISWVNPYQ